jgi:hypothetical protein
MSQDLGTQETTSVRADYLVELRGFEPLTSAVQEPARLTGISLRVLVGDSWSRPTFFDVD